MYAGRSDSRYCWCCSTCRTKRGTRWSLGPSRCWQVLFLTYVSLSPLMDCIYYIHKMMVYLLSFQVECGLPCCSWKSHFRSPLMAEDIDLLKTSIDVKLNSEIFKKKNLVPWIWRAISRLHFSVPTRGEKLTFMCTLRISCVRYISWKLLLD